MNTSTIIIIIAVIVVVVLAGLLLVRGRKQHVTFSDTPPLTPKAAPPKIEPAPQPVASAPPAPPVASPGTSGAEADTLTQLKGLGPKAAGILAGLGVTRFEQIAAWNDADIAAIDAQMGAFAGRITRDRWVDQAKLLASGDTAAFEAEFGALGR
jgi:predicted flap endonuclease-1-like 5' DNA nuclease